MKFSERYGMRHVRSTFQIDNIDRALATRLWNSILTDWFGGISESMFYDYNITRENACKAIWTDFLIRPIDKIPIRVADGNVHFENFRGLLNRWYDASEWHEKYDLLEFLCSLGNEHLRKSFTQSCNSALTKEASGYRIVEGKVLRITSEDEIGAVEEAIDFTPLADPVRIHLETALDLLSSRNNPDYRNSIKESISAVESACCSIVGSDKATLGQALKEIEKHHRIHSSLKAAFSSLYGYTSDSGGIRHAIIQDDIEVTFDDAKFMLVTCSSFINFLRAKVEIQA